MVQSNNSKALGRNMGLYERCDTTLPYDPSVELSPDNQEAANYYFQSNSVTDTLL